jgi:GTP-binding protein Era
VKSGFAAVVGRPNVGKSTLVNTLVGSKVAITSTRPQTTRNTIRGVVTGPDPLQPEYQIVLVDTPGLHKPKTELGKRLNSMVYGTLAEADVVVFLIDGTAPIGPGDSLIAERLAAAKSTVILGVNKTDTAGKGEIARHDSSAQRGQLRLHDPIQACPADLQLRRQALCSYRQDALSGY